jgi:class 3 adenylate cyclase
MPPLPGGTVTFVFTDIEGSTRLLQQLGDGYAEVADAHRRIVRETFANRGGTEVDTQGDAFFYSFPRARDAVAAAVDAQRSLATHPWPEGTALKVRMGVHTGEPAVGEAGYIGLDVHRAARICASGHGGQVLLSDATKALVGTAMPDGVHVQDLGEHELKDIDGREHLWGLAVDGLDDSFPPPRTTAGPNPLESRESQFEARIEQYVMDRVEQAFKPKSEGGSQARGVGGLALVGLGTLAGLVLILILLVLIVRWLFF